MASRKRAKRNIDSNALLAFVVSAAACSSECPTLEECDIRSTSCQRHTADVAACLRGRGTADPPVIVVDAEAFVQSQVDDATNNPPTQDSIDLGRGLALFGLAPPETDPSATIREYWTNVAAFFSGQTGKVTVLDRGAPLDGAGAVRLLLHELVHAMQHRELSNDYYDQHETTYDDSLVLTSLIEGEAVLYQDLATAFAYDRDPSDVEWDDIFRGFEERQWDAARQDDAPYEMASLRLPYAFGGALLNWNWRSGGNDAVRAAFTHPPASTRQLIGGTASRGVARENPNEVGNPVLPSEFEHVATRHIGAWLFDVFRDLWSSAPRTFRDFADPGFAGDVLTIFRTPASRGIVSVWRLRFDTPAKASEVFADLRTSKFSMDRRDRDLIVVAGSDGQFTTTSIEGWTTAPEQDSTDQTSPNGTGAIAPWSCPTMASAAHAAR